MRTLQSILIDANAYLDLEAAVPTGTELTTRTNYANQAVWEASALAQFSEFDQVYTVTATGATVPLASNFREFKTEPRYLLDSGRWSDPIEVIAPEDMYDKEADDKYCYVLGNPSEGYKVIFNGLSANATVSFVTQRYPSGLATLTDVCELPDPTFVVKDIETNVLESRSDDRFPSVKADRNARLQNMIGRETKRPGTNMVPRTGAAKYSIGG